MITALYASLLCVIYMALTWRVIAYRRSNRIGLGDAGDKSLLKRMRAHANFVETVPFALILIFLLEFMGASGTVVHLLGSVLVLGRALHGIGFSASPPNLTLRSFGMGSTLGVIAVAAILLLFNGITQ